MDEGFQKRKHPIHFPVKEGYNRPKIIFLTVCSRGRREIFAREEVFQIIVDSWKSATYWVVGKFVIMPDHIHLFCANADYRHPDIKPWVVYWKSLISNRWPYKEEHPLWQEDFWDRQLRSSEHYLRKSEYMSYNPVWSGLVKDVNDWPYQGELNVLQW